MDLERPLKTKSEDAVGQAVFLDAYAFASKPHGVAALSDELMARFTPKIISHARDVEPSVHKVVDGETVSKIASDLIGAGASREDVHKYVQEISKLNNLSDSDEIQAGQELRLPGKTFDGGMVIDGADGKRTVTWKDGRRIVAEPSVIVQTTPGPENSAADSLVTGIDSARVLRERSRVYNNLTNGLARDPETLKRVEQDIVNFEMRAQEQKLKESEIAATYECISTMLESSDSKYVSQRDRARVGAQILHQSAYPSTVRQGYHFTCNVASIENRLYTRYPASAASLVTQVATTGQFIAADGRRVRVPPGSLVPDEEAHNSPAFDGERSHASQIFQVAAVNDHYDRSNRATPLYGEVYYEQEPGRSAQDSGERLYDYLDYPRRALKNSTGARVEGPDLAVSALQDISNSITGMQERNIVLVHENFPSDKALVVRSKEELAEKLVELQKENKLPVIVRVDTRLEPFFTDSRRGTEGGSGASHVLTISGFDATTERVQLDNQWHQQADHEISLADLYRAMQGSQDSHVLASLREEVEQNRQSGKVDGSREFELLRLRHLQKQLSEGAYDQKIAKRYLQQMKRWQERGESFQGEQSAAIEKYFQMLNLLPPERADRIRLRRLIESAYSLLC